jgi:hypothetical protein
VQVLFLLASAAATLWTVRAVAANGSPAGPALASALLLGYGVAPALALGGWLLLRREAHGPAKRAVVRARLQQAGLHAVHLAVALVLVGYATSTYAKAETRGQLGTGETLAVGGFQLTYHDSATSGPAGAGADAIRPAFTWSSASASGRLAGILDWEEQVGAHLPRPAIARTWTSDLYVEVEAVHVAAGGPCAPDHPDGYWIQAYQGQVPSRVCTGAAIDAVKVRAVGLPGLAVLWGGAAVGVLALVLRMGVARKGARADGAAAPSAPA